MSTTICNSHLHSTFFSAICKPKSLGILLILLISIGIGSFTLGDDATKSQQQEKNHLRVISLARQPQSDFFKRFNASINRLELNYEIFPIESEQQNSEDKSWFTRQLISVDKVRLALSKYREQDNLIVLLTLDDRIVLNGREQEFLEKYDLISTKYGQKVLFASGNGDKDGPNCKIMIGQARALWDLFDQKEAIIEDDKNSLNNDVELYCQRIFADENRRSSLALVIDEKFEIFQSLSDFKGLENKLKLVEMLDGNELHNLATLTKPIVILPDKTSDTTHLLNSLGNYLGLAWTRRNGSSLLNENDRLPVSSSSSLTMTSNDDELPKKAAEIGILIGLFILEPTPFLDNFFELVLKLDWPKKRIHLILYNSVVAHQKQVDTFRARVSQLPFASFKILTFANKAKSDFDINKSKDKLIDKSMVVDDEISSHHEDASTLTKQIPKRARDFSWQTAGSDPTTLQDAANINKLELEAELEFSAELEAQLAALQHCKQLGPSECDYYLYLDSLARISSSDLLQQLIETKQTIVAPMLSRPSRLWANFWASQTSDNYYSRSFDYVDLVKGDKLGLWTVNLIRNVYLIEASFIRRQLNRSTSSSGGPNRLEFVAEIGDLSGRKKGLNFAGDVADKQQTTSKQHNKHIKPEMDHRQHYLSSLNYLSSSQVKSGSSSKESAFKLSLTQLVAQKRVNFALLMAKEWQSLGKLQFMLNTKYFGHLVDPTSYDLNKTRPDMYQMEDNILDWEREYLHPNYTRIFDDNNNNLVDDISTIVSQKNKPIDVASLITNSSENSTTTTSSIEEDVSQVRPNEFIEEPCRDVYWFPLVSEKFTQDMIAIMEQFGQWSSGTNDDPRIEGGYESVPTRDIHFRQVGLHDQWLLFLRYYVMPVQLRQFIGYEHDPPRADLAFVVRYHPAEQASLRAHHDSSTYTLNIALNSPQLGHYEGGGCRFVRQNCSVTQSRSGWALIHPGRLTHYHEGLPVRAGTRYILVTFIDP